MKHLNILELHRTIHEKQMRKEECFERVLGICHKKISVAAENKKLKCVIDVPEYVVGYPIFDINQCMTYIIKCLTNNGFLVNYYFPKTLYISWDYDEIKESKETEGKKKASMATAAVTKPLPQGLLPAHTFNTLQRENLMTSLLARPSHAMKLKTSGKLELSF